MNLQKNKEKECDPVDAQKDLFENLNKNGSGTVTVGANKDWIDALGKVRDTVEFKVSVKCLEMKNKAGSKFEYTYTELRVADGDEKQRTQTSPQSAKGEKKWKWGCTEESDNIFDDELTVTRADFGKIRLVGKLITSRRALALQFLFNFYTKRKSRCPPCFFGCTMFLVVPVNRLPLTRRIRFVGKLVTSRQQHRFNSIDAARMAGGLRRRCNAGRAEQARDHGSGVQGGVHEDCVQLPGVDSRDG